MVDPLGKLVPNAKLVLLQDDKELVEGRSDAEGSFSLAAPNAGRYSLRVEAAGFATQILSDVFIAEGKNEELTVTLNIGPLAQQIVVSATGVAVPESQVGASISVIDQDQIQALNKLDVLENLRLITGSQVVQIGQRGGASISITSEAENQTSTKW